MNSSKANLTVVVLAAGKGTRMKCSTPKVLHKLTGKPLLFHVLDTAFSLNPIRVVVVLNNELFEQRQNIVNHYPGDIGFVRQEQPLGTGHAVKCAIEQVPPGTDAALVMYADVPLIGLEVLTQMIAATGLSGAGVGSETLVLLTAHCRSTTNSYGRILHDDRGRVKGIVEKCDCDADQRNISRVYSGVMALPYRQLTLWLDRLRPHNAQEEYYLTDIVSLARSESIPIAEIQTSEEDIQGVNTLTDLSRLERIYNRRKAIALMNRGVRIHDPDRFDLRGELICGRDVTIDVNCIITGRVELADGVKIGAHCCLSDCTIGARTTVHPYSHLEGLHTGQDTQIGPFCRVRPESTLGDRARVGNFVEVKNASLSNGVKASHLSYLGDGRVGKDSNIGAGTIFCNYDGVNKRRTEIGERTFIGSNTILVAPVKVGDDVIVGAGTVVRKPIPSGSLAVDRRKNSVKPDFSERYWRGKTKD